MSEHGDDRALADRMLAGDEAAFEEFFRENFDRLFRFAMTRVNHDIEAAEDVVQATFCRAVASLGGYRAEASLFTWICTTCRREIHALHERRDPFRDALELVEDTAEIRLALERLSGMGSEGPHDELHRKELGRLVQVTLDHLPASYGNALEWKYIQDLSVNEIAARLNLRAKAAESLLTRAREAFRNGFATITRHAWRLQAPER